MFEALWNAEVRAFTGPFHICFVLLVVSVAWSPLMLGSASWASKSGMIEAIIKNAQNKTIWSAIPTPFECLADNISDLWLYLFFTKRIVILSTISVIPFSEFHE